ncbi:MAG TPA: hypothetical protein VN703_06300 [Candidatus Sulfopaludibacter sp.]|nr:hypothetical protein [Candidatus Sulfopaludibacter sp.]
MFDLGYLGVLEKDFNHNYPYLIERRGTMSSYRKKKKSITNFITTKREG